MCRLNNKALLAIHILIFSVACSQHLAVQPKYSAQGKSAYFDDGRSDRPPIEGTIAQAQIAQPIDWSRGDIIRAQERYSIYCSVCHDGGGAGYGPVVHRGFKRPLSFDEASVRTLSDKELYQIITNGVGSMSGFASSIPDRDRRLIVGYIRILQLRTHVPSPWLSDADVQKLRASE